MRGKHVSPKGHAWHVVGNCNATVGAVVFGVVVALFSLADIDVGIVDIDEGAAGNVSMCVVTLVDVWLVVVETELLVAAVLDKVDVEGTLDDVLEEAIVVVETGGDDIVVDDDGGNDVVVMFADVLFEVINTASVLGTT